MRIRSSQFAFIFYQLQRLYRALYLLIKVIVEDIQNVWYNLKKLKTSLYLQARYTIYDYLITIKFLDFQHIPSTIHPHSYLSFSPKNLLYKFYCAFAHLKISLFLFSYFFQSIKRIER